MWWLLRCAAVAIVAACALAAKKVTTGRKVFTLAPPSVSGDSYEVATSTFLVGPHRDRRKLYSLALQSKKKLQKAKDLHVRLADRIAAEQHHLADHELHELKKQKLHAKDAVARLMRGLHPTSAPPSDFAVELGSGGFGRVLVGHALADGRGVAIKVASLGDSAALEQEKRMLDAVKDVPGFAVAQFFGKQTILGQGTHAVLVLGLLGPSVDRLFMATHLGARGFAPTTVLRLADQLLERLAALAARGVVHCDLSPANWLMGLGTGTGTGEGESQGEGTTPGGSSDNGTVHLIDFGLAHLDADATTTTTTTTATDALRGTLLFSSAAAMRGVRCSYKDDLECLAYALAYLLCNDLPWSRADAGLDEDDPDHDTKLVALVAARKDTCTGEELCRGRAAGAAGDAAAEAVAAMHAHAKALGAHVVPDYPRLRGLVADLLAGVDAGDRGGGWDWEAEGITWGANGVLSLSPPGDH